MEGLLEDLGITLHLRDERNAGHRVETAFLGELTPEQTAAADAALAAITAFGKTVVAASVIAARGTSTLVLVHRRQLMEQWIARLGAFLDLPSSPIGQVGGGKREPMGIVDVGVIQSLVRKSEVDDIVADYGHLVVDEYHHLLAVSFEAVACRAKAGFVLGLSATVTRKDGHHPIIFMQCGPVWFRAHAKAHARQRPFGHRALLRPTAFRMPERVDGEPPPILLTERKDYAQHFADRLDRFARNVLLLRGGMGVRQRREVMRRLKDVSDTEERVLIATGRYIDDARLDTLFLAMPVSWRGTLAQYVGRLHRLHLAKREVLVYDYVDDVVPTLRRMSEKRIRGYGSLGYSVERFSSRTVA